MDIFNISEPVTTKLWREAVVPAFDALSDEIKELYRIAAEDDEERRIRDDGTRVWPPGLKFQKDLDKLSTEELAKASWITYFYGHWMENVRTQPRFHPGHWKLSNYADQILRSRLGLQTVPEQHGHTFKVQFGMLYLNYSTLWEWHSEPIGFATSDTLEEARKITANTTTRDYLQTLAEIKKHTWPKSGPLFEAADIFNPI